jgi:hypothetical protein
MMGADAAITPVMMNVAASKDAPQRPYLSKIPETESAPRGGLMRVAHIIRILKLF